MSSALVLDAGALIAIERRSPQLQEPIRGAHTRNASVVVPTAVLAQVVRPGGRQVNLRRFLADSYLRFAGLDYSTALRIGALLGETGTSDVVDAAVVVCARGTKAGTDRHSRPRGPPKARPDTTVDRHLT